MADVSTDFTTRDIDCIDPVAYGAKHKVSDQYMPFYLEIIAGNHATKYVKAMKHGFSSLYKILLTLTPGGHRCPTFRGTWTFELKQYLDCSTIKFKARYCVGGDLQCEGVDYFLCSCDTMINNIFGAYSHSFVSVCHQIS